MRVLAGVLVLTLASIEASAQTPQPFPTPRPPQPATQSAGAQAPAPVTQKPPTTAKPAAPAPPAPAPAAVAAAPAVQKTQGPDLGGIPLYPNAVYLTSYDAGRGQRFHLYGVMLPYAEAVNFYRTALKQKGDELFESPPTHQFEVARFREQDMAFPPSVTIKDYTWGGSAGYVNPKGGTPERFPTVIQIVPLPFAK
jgi:hypothetical protein